MTMHEPNRPKDQVATRQGTKQTMNARVLVTSTALIALIFAGFYFAFVATNETSQPAPQAPAAATPTTPAPSNP